MSKKRIETVGGGDFRRWSLAARARQLRQLVSARLSLRMGWPLPPGNPPVAWSPILVPLLGDDEMDQIPGQQVFGTLDKALRTTRRGAADTPMTRLIAREIAGSAPPKTAPPRLPPKGWLLLGQMAFGVPDFLFWLRHRLLDDLCSHSLCAPADGDLPPLDAQDLWLPLLIDASIEREPLTGPMLPALRDALGLGKLGFWGQYLTLEMALRAGVKLPGLPLDLAHELRDWSLLDEQRYKAGLTPKMVSGEGNHRSTLSRRMTRGDLPDWFVHLLPVDLIVPQQQEDEAHMPVPAVTSDPVPVDAPSPTQRSGPAKGWMGQGAPPTDMDRLPDSRQADTTTDKG
ncbi:MAG: hypothetical protein Alpg2KO_28240 [Alphaproteobacteria bacterium]